MLLTLCDFFGSWVIDCSVNYRGEDSRRNYGGDSGGDWGGDYGGDCGGDCSGDCSGDCGGDCGGNSRSSRRFR